MTLKLLQDMNAVLDPSRDPLRKPMDIFITRASLSGAD